MCHLPFFFFFFFGFHAAVTRGSYILHFLIAPMCLKNINKEEFKRAGCVLKLSSVLP